MKALLIAPFPPPVSGHSLASQVLVDGMRTTDDVRRIDLGRDSMHDGRISTRRVLAVLRTVAAVARGRWTADVVYLTISESVAGNFKDLCIYAICIGALRRTVVHLHGGSLRRLLFDPHPVIRRANAVFLRSLGGAIISGRSHRDIFDGLIDAERVHIVPNFAPDDLFVPPEAIAAKFAKPGPIRVLYLSGMTPLKGYLDLFEGLRSLPVEVRERMRVDFAGRFYSEAERVEFADRLRDVRDVYYHGMVDDATKRRLFADAHVFCLPSAHLEGQPISILEAYASGCVVVTTCPSGTRDIFTPGKNGYAVDARSPASIADALTRLVRERDSLARIAQHNRAEAGSCYRASTFVAAVRGVLQGVAGAH